MGDGKLPIENPNPPVDNPCVLQTTKRCILSMISTQTHRTAMRRMKMNRAETPDEIFF